VRPTDREELRRWLRLAIASLVIAGSFSLLVVVARLPPIARHISDATFFKRGLVIHVDLSLVVWFTAFLVGLAQLLPARGRAGRLGAPLAAAGVALLCAGIGVPAAPVLANYVPVLDHPLYLAGLALVAIGAAVALAGRRLVPAAAERPSGIAAALRGAAVAFFVALVTLLASWIATPEGLDTHTAYELRFWGAGHVLQVAHTAGMLAAWQLLVEGATGRPLTSPRVAALLVGLLVAPALVGPLLTGGGTTSITYQVGFTRLMQLGIVAPVAAFMVLGLRALARARAFRDPRAVAFAASAALITLGFVLGALIRGSNTMVPAHYHAAIGAVTVSYMGVAYGLFALVGRAARASLARWQPALFGVGQAVFAAGFALAGAQGMARKTYGQEQHIRTTAETIGLGVMGLGGLIAVAGGVVFLVAAIAALRHRPEEIDGLARRPSPAAAPHGQPLAAARPRGAHPDPVLHRVGLARAGEHAGGDAALMEAGR
jgi:hypothetical protein